MTDSSTRHNSPHWFGFVNVNKPAGLTSRQAVDRVKRLVKPAKIGHAGTLDPLASGVLVLCVGHATRLVPYVHELSKAYRAEFLLGHRSPSDDIEANVEVLDNAPVITPEQIEAALPQFIGQVEQVPPAFSAVKINGKRAYDLARQGKPVEIKSRIVEIESIDFVSLIDQTLRLDIVCGSGTYIRSVGRDLARVVGTEAVMSDLVRTRIGPFTLDDAVSPEEITAESLAAHIVPPHVGLEGMPLVDVPQSSADLLFRGLRCPCPENCQQADETEVAVLPQGEGGRLASIAVVTGEGRMLQPRHVFIPPSSTR